MADKKFTPLNIRYSRIGKQFQGEKDVLYNRVKPKEASALFQEKLAVAREKLVALSEQEHPDVEQIQKLNKIILNLKTSIERCEEK